MKASTKTQASAEARSWGGFPRRLVFTKQGLDRGGQCPAAPVPPFRSDPNPGRLSKEREPGCRRLERRESRGWARVAVHFLGGSRPSPWTDPKRPAPPIRSTDSRRRLRPLGKRQLPHERLSGGRAAATGRRTWPGRRIGWLPNDVAVSVPSVKLPRPPRLLSGSTSWSTSVCEAGGFARNAVKCVGASEAPEEEAGVAVHVPHTGALLTDSTRGEEPGFPWGSRCSEGSTGAERGPRTSAYDGVGTPAHANLEGWCPCQLQRAS
jgi:hypothetical protein